jgi:hypothetical protein
MPTSKVFTQNVSGARAEIPLTPLGVRCSHFPDYEYSPLMLPNLQDLDYGEWLGVAYEQRGIKRRGFMRRGRKDSSDAFPWRESLQDLVLGTADGL